MLLGADGANRSPLPCFDSGRVHPNPFFQQNYAFTSSEQAPSHCVAFQTEVSFITLCKMQPTFGEIDCYARKQGFIPLISLN